MLKAVLGQVVSNVLLFGLVFGMAGTVDFTAFKSKFKKFKGILVGELCQFVILPLTGFLVVQVFNSSFFGAYPILAQMLLITVSSPGGSYSNWWCSLINADLALSVAMTTVSTIISMGMLPLNLYLYITLAMDGGVNASCGGGGTLDWQDLGVSLGIVVVGILSGLAVGSHYPEKHSMINKFGNVMGLLLIIFGLVYTAIGGSSTSKPWNKPMLEYVVVGVPCLVGLILAYAGATLVGLRREERVAIAIETCYQNTGVAVAIALSMAPDVGNECAAEAATIPVLYGMGEILIIGCFALLSWKCGQTLSPPSDPICKVLFEDYQHLSPDAQHPDELSVDKVAALQPSVGGSEDRTSKASMPLVAEYDRGSKASLASESVPAGSLVVDTDRASKSSMPALQATP